MQPVATPMDVEFYAPNFDLWANILRDQQKTFDDTNAYIRTDPNYDPRIDQGARDNYVAQRQAEEARVADVYANQGVLAGNRALSQLAVDTKAAFSPGGDAYQLMARQQMIQAEKEKIQELYKDNPTDIRYAIDRLYADGVQDFRLQDGSYGSVLGARTPTPFTAQERIDIENDILSQIKDDLITRYPEVAEVFRRGEDSLVKVMTSLEGVPRERAMAIIEQRMPRELIDYAVFHNEAQGMFLPQGADPYSFLKRDDKGNVTGYNEANPLINDYLGMVSSVTRMKENATVRSITDHAAIEEQKLLNARTGTIPRPGWSQNNRSVGSFSGDVNSQNMIGEVVAAESALNQRAVAFYNRQNPDGQNVSEEEKIQWTQNAIKNLSEKEWQKRFGETGSRGALMNLQEDYAQKADEYTQMQDIGDNAGEALMPGFKNRQNELRLEIEAAIASTPELQGYTVDQVLGVTPDEQIIGNVSGPGGVPAANQGFNVNGQFDRNPALQKIVDIKERLSEKYQAAERRKAEVIDDLLNDNVSQQFQVVSRPTQLDPKTQQVDVRATKEMDSFYQELEDDPQKIMTMRGTGRNGESLIMGDVVIDAMRAATGREPTEAELGSLKYIGQSITPDANGDLPIQFSFVNEDMIPTPIFIGGIDFINDRLYYAGNSEEGLINTIRYSDDLEEVEFATELYVNGNTNKTMGATMARANIQPRGTTFTQKDANRNPIFNVEITDSSRGGIPVTDAMDNATGRYILIYPLDPNTGQRFINDNGAEVSFTTEGEAKQFLKGVQYSRFTNE